MISRPLFWHSALVLLLPCKVFLILLAGPYLSPDDVAGRQFMYPVTLEPPLSITAKGADVIPSWPEAVGWRPHRSTTLAAGSWTLITTASTLQGNVRSLRLPRAQAREFSAWSA